MKNRFRSLAALLLLTTCTTASAVVIDFGEITAGSSVADFFVEPVGDFSDTILFSLTETLNVGISIDANDLAPFWEIANFLAVSGSADITFDYSPSDNHYSFIGQLQPGDYSIDITGSGTGTFGGQYSASIGALAPIPLPAAFWLFAGALLALRKAKK